jgi:hypothetical protein
MFMLHSTKSVNLFIYSVTFFIAFRNRSFGLKEICELNYSA